MQSLNPVSYLEQRQWLKERVDELGAEELRELCPALRKLFNDT